jgi:hypothetical protein
MAKALAHKNREENEAQVVTKALTKAADYWQINNKQLGRVIGVSEAVVSRLKNGHYLLAYDSKHWQLALMFLRTVRGLDAYMGGHVENEKLWLRANNSALNGVPLELMQNVEGLAHVVQYVDCMRGQQ